MKLARSVDFKVYGPDNKTFRRARINAEPGTLLDERGVEAVKNAYMNALNSVEHGLVYKCVPITHRSFNCICVSGEA
jgi:hypothetical protein